MIPIPIGDEPRPEGFTPVVNWLLILVNLVVYGVTTHRANSVGELIVLFHRWGFTPASPTAATAITSMFIHADAWHFPQPAGAHRPYHHPPQRQ